MLSLVFAPASNNCFAASGVAGVQQGVDGPAVGAAVLVLRQTLDQDRQDRLDGGADGCRHFHLATLRSGGRGLGRRLDCGLVGRFGGGLLGPGTFGGTFDHPEHRGLAVGEAVDRLGVTGPEDAPAAVHLPQAQVRVGSDAAANRGEVAHHPALRDRRQLMLAEARPRLRQHLDPLVMLGTLFRVRRLGHRFSDRPRVAVADGVNKTRRRVCWRGVGLR